MKNLITISLIALLTSCASAQTKDPAQARPDWVDGRTSNTYPTTKYVIAVGNGSTREGAVQNAKNALASSFLQKVESQSSSDSKSELKEDTSSQSSGEATSNSRSAVQISTSIQLRGAEIAQFWQDPGTGENYALAVLDKLKVRNSYLLDLNRMKEKLQTLHANFKAHPDQKNGREILDQAKAYADLAREASAIGTPMGATDPVPERDLQTVRAKLIELKQAKAIAIELAGKGDAAEQEAGDLKSLLATCLQDKGYSISEGGGNGAVKFSGTYRVNSKHLKVEGFNKYEFSVKASLAQGAHSDSIFMPREASGREQDQAFDGIKGELSDAVCAAIVQAL